MSSDSFTKENLDTYLKELAKEFRKRLGGRCNAGGNRRWSAAPLF